MDILNWIYLKTHKLLKDSVQDPQDLVILGSKVGIEKRGDVCQSYAVPYSAFAGSIAEGGCFTPDITTDSANTIESPIGHYTKIGNLVTLHIQFTIIYDPVVQGDTVEIILPQNLKPEASVTSVYIGELSCPDVNVVAPTPSVGASYFSDYRIKMNNSEVMTILIGIGTDDHPFRGGAAIKYYAHVTYPLNPSIC